MKKLLLSALIVLSLGLSSTYATSKKGEMDNCQVVGGKGSLLVESNEKAKLTITVMSEEGTLILSEEVSSESGKLQLLGLETGVYKVEIKSKKTSKVFQVEVQ